MALDVEVIGDGGVGREEALRCHSACNPDPGLECAPRIGQIERLAIDRGRAF